jgi:hypothetical protein
MEVSFVKLLTWQRTTALTKQWFQLRQQSRLHVLNWLPPTSRRWHAIFVPCVLPTQGLGGPAWLSDLPQLAVLSTDSGLGLSSQDHAATSTHVGSRACGLLRVQPLERSLCRNSASRTAAFAHASWIEIKEWLYQTCQPSISPLCKAIPEV